MIYSDNDETNIVVHSQYRLNNRSVKQGFPAKIVRNPTKSAPSDGGQTARIFEAFAVRERCYGRRFGGAFLSGVTFWLDFMSSRINFASSLNGCPAGAFSTNLCR